MFGSKNNSIGVIGLGIIGSRVAERLRNADFNVYVWNRSIKPEPNFMASPAEVAEVAPVIQIFVRDAEALIAVMEDMKPALTPEHVVLCHSTVNAWGIRRAAAIAASTGAGFLDAPFTGSKGAAEKGELVYYIGGESAPLERARKVLEFSGKKIIPLGKAGDATILKIATNLISAAVVEALAEAIAITKAEGIDISKLQEALAANANVSPLITMKLPTMAARSYAPHFSLKNMLKDARYAQAIADEKGLALPVLNASAQAMDRGVRSGQGEFDYSVVLENFAPMLRAVEERAARSKPKEIEPAAEAPVPPATEEPKPAVLDKESSDKDKAATKGAPADEAKPKPADGDSSKTSKHAKLVPASVSADDPLPAKPESSKPSSSEKKAKDKAASEPVALTVSKLADTGPDTQDKPAENEPAAKTADSPSAIPEPDKTGLAAEDEPVAEALAKEEAVPTKAATNDTSAAESTNEKVAASVTENPKAAGLPKPPAIAKAGLKPTAPGAPKPAIPLTKIPDSKAEVTAEADPSQTSSKLQISAPVKKPSFVSRLFGGFGKKDKKVHPAPANPAPAPVKAFKTSESKGAPGATSGKLENKDAQLAGKLTDSPLSEVLVGEPGPAQGEKEESKAAAPTLANPPTESKPSKPARSKEPSAPPTTLVAKLLSDTEADDEEEEGPIAVVTPSLKEEQTPEKPVSNPDLPDAPVAKSDEAAPSPQPTSQAAEPEVPASLNETASEIASAPSETAPEPDPLPPFDPSKTVEDISRELAAKLSAFPKIPERQAVVPTLVEEPLTPPPSAPPPQTRLQGLSGIVVPNLAPAPPPSMPAPGQEAPAPSFEEPIDQAADTPLPTLAAEKTKASRKKSARDRETAASESSDEPEGGIQVDDQVPPQP